MTNDAPARATEEAVARLPGQVTESEIEAMVAAMVVQSGAYPVVPHGYRGRVDLLHPFTARQCLLAALRMLDFDRALSPPPTVGAEDEAVGWMHPTAHWVSVNRETIAMHCRKDELPTPLYTRPSPSAVAGKGLEWLEHPDGIVTASIGGLYYRLRRGEDGSWRNEAAVTSYLGEHGEISSIKSAAQADFEQRIRSCTASEKGGA